MSYWLPEDYTIKLNSFQLGALAAIIDTARKRNECNFKTARPGADGSPEPITMVNLLYDKVMTALQEGPKTSNEVESSFDKPRKRVIRLED